MKKILVVHYSQSGQLNDVTKHFTQPLADHPAIEVTFEAIAPVKPYPFPWPFFTFFDTFPESVYLDPPEMQPCGISGDENFDLVILAYQVWFLSPSLPITGFLKSDTAKKLLNGKPVVTLIVCRNMWLMAQEEVKNILDEYGAKLVGNVALTDECGSAMSFFSTPLWVLTGNKGPRLGGLIPKAGVAPEAIKASKRFGERICQRLTDNVVIDETLLRNLEAVDVNERLIASEKTARRGFKIWGRLIRSMSPSGDPKRKPILLIYALFLIFFICTFIPLSVLIKAAVAPFTKVRVKKQKYYFEQPSGFRD
ncbi:MAG: dialkylrecorsinol condensing enzyme [Gammaproteobacteria bacterium]|nr:MAG: dialkylrecorsinol condensing enzyme [Gammaproteobacteria bacterium]